MIFILSISSKAEACLCENFETVCDAYANARTIVTGKVVSIKDFTNDQVTNAFKTGQLVLFSIDKTYKGDLKNSVEIWQPYSSCDHKFTEKDVGKPYLLYLHHWNDQKRLSIISCGRSRQLIGGEGEVSWLDNLPSSLKRPFFHGSLQEYEYDNDDWPQFKANIRNSRIELIGEKRTFRQTGNENGFFEFWDLPNDTYRLRIDAGKDFRFENIFIRGFWDIDPDEKLNFDPLNDHQFEVDGEGCSEVNYDLMKDKKRQVDERNNN